MMMVFVVFLKHNGKKKYEQELKRLSNIDLIGQMAEVSAMKLEIQ